ncbi:YDG domain-containing protein [uncultured Selenomonas sp.]|uniref:YDG domain-containing protein n=1 Tax=uncultured Selenomonas sp. TaxID=159275 RepID=UPI0028EB85C3|nr:YDG domain-containing protein [uncultured Selenomonas sp.]
MSKKDALACQVSLGLFAGLLGIASTAHGAPIHDGGGTNHDGVRAGSPTISQSGATTNITSTTTNNVIGWKDFSVKSGETVQFDSGSNTNNYLNIVTGNVTSRIDGAMEGGKNVYIANPNGVVFGKGAEVKVGSLYVTTRKLNADTIGAAVTAGTINLNAPDSAGVTSTIINQDAASSAGLAQADIVSLVDGTGSVKATKIVLEGKSVRIMNDAKIDSTNVYAVADQSPLTVDAGGSKTVRDHKGYVHVGYETTAPTHGGAGKYKNLGAANMYKLVEDKAGLDAIRTNTASLAGNYMLRKDIDFADAAHTAIGTNAHPFTGKFDGMFHEIKNMTLLPGTSTDYAGLFGNTSKAEIMNVGIRDANLSDLDYGGAVVGKAGKGTHIFNVYNEVTGPAPAATKTIGSTGGHEVGGIVGRTDGGSNSGEEVSLDNAYNTAAIETGAAGLVGYIKGMSRVYAVYNAGKLNSATTSQAGYQSMEGTSFIKNAYTSQGARLGDSDASLNAYDSYATSTGKAKLLNTTKVTGTAVDDKDAKQASSYGAWDISDEGGENKTWRIFAGQSNPLLRVFMQGTVQAEYSYAEFEQPGHAHSGNVSNTYTDRIPTADGTIAKNNGKSVPERTYDATYRKITKADGTEVQNVSDVNIVGYTAPVANDPREIKLDADHGRRNAGKSAVLYGGQHGYDITGANVTIKKRSVKAGLGTNRPIEREYDGTTDMTQALKAALTGISTEGLVAGDDVAIDTVHSTLTANTADANAGYGKTLTLAGTLTYTGTDRVNYEDIDATSGNLTLPSGLTGNIRQKKVTVGLDAAKDYSKTYDGTSAVKSGVDPKTTNDVLQLTGVVGSEDLKLNYNDITAKYMAGKGATDTERSKAGTNVDIAYKNIKLADGTTGLARNYRLVDAAGNVLYRDSLTGEPTDMTNPANSADPRYIGAATTVGGTLWGKGDIKKRKIDPTKFTVTGGADRAYNGTDYLVVDGTTKKVTGPAAAANTDTNIVASDAGKISFSISASDNKAYYINSSNTRTKNAYDAANAADGAQYLSYTLKAHNETAEDILSNYELDRGSGEALSEGSVHTVTGEGKITPRTVYVDLLKKTGIDKEYDKDVNVLAADKQFGTNFGYRAAAANANKLVKEDGAADDGAQITATAAVYKTKSGHTEHDDEVYRTGNALTGAVENDGKNVEYTIGLTGDHAATNYVLSYTPSGGGAAQTSRSVTMTGTGKITPKQLTIAAPGDVTRAYDQTSNVYAKQLKDLGYNHVTNGVLGGDTVNLALGADNAVVGKYYTDNTKATPAENANARSNGSFLPGQTYYTVNYTFTPTLDNGNYEVANTVADGRGKITQYKPTSANFKMDFGDVTKTFDGTTAVSQSAGLSALNITLENGQTVDFLATPNSYTMAGKEYADKHANTDRSGTLLTGKPKIDVTYKVKLPGGGAGNYDLSGIGGGDYTLTGDMYSGYTVARKKAAGYIKPKEVLATVSKPNVTKTYNRATDVLDEHGQASGGGAIINMPDLVLGNGSNISEGAYDNVHVGTGKTVTYTLKVSSGYENDYYFVSTPGGASITTLTGQGTINPRAIDVEFKPAVKNYDGTSDVKFTGTTPAWGYTLKALNDDADKANTEAFLAADNPTLNTAAGTTLKGHYVDANGTRQSDAGDYTNLVQYSGIKNALSSGDYTIADSKKGSGTINKRQVNAGDFNLDFAGVTKVYDATKDVKKNGDAAQAAGYINEVSVDLGGTVGKKYFTNGNGYSLVKAEYANPNVTANGGTGNVTYTLKLDSGLLKNYSFADLNNAAGQTAGYSYDSANNTITRKLGVGTITKRPVYALVNGNVSKTYDAATTVLGADKSVLTGDGLLKLGDKLANGTTKQDAGLVEINGTKYGTNESTAKYVDKNAAEGTKTVNYTLKIDPTYASNYEFFDARTGAAVNPDASNNYIISTNTNTIKKAALTVRQDPGSPISKSYDGGTTVEDGDGRLLLDNGLTDENGNQDNVSLNPYPAATPPANAYTLTYNSPNVTNAATAKNNVTYKHLQLMGTDAGNYYLADAGGTALADDTTAGYFTMTGDGAITPLKVTNQNLVFKFNPITKTYDGNAKVGGTDNEATWKSYINDIFIKKADGSRLIDLNNDIDKVTKAEYQAGGGSRAKDAATGKKVLFNVKFKDEMLQNLEFDNSIYTPDAQGNHMLSDKTYDRYTTGDITKKLLTATLDQSANLRKVYDGTKDADKENLKIAGKLDGDSLEYGKTALYDDANANINPGAASQNSRVITYTTTLGGTDAVNYAFDNAGANTKTLTARGDIEKRKVYARVNQDVRKKYDGTTDVKINGVTPTNGDAYVTFGRSSNAAEAATTGMVGGYGTNDTTAAYQDANAGTNKQVNYTLAIGGADANGHNFKDNYVIYDANRPTVEVTTLSTYTNIIDKASLMLNAAYADKQYDGTRTVKNLGTLLTLTGAPTGIGIQTGYTGTYLDENVNEKGVDYSNVRLSGSGASNYTLSYDGNDLTSDASGNYSFHGSGRITKRLIGGDADLKVKFTGAPISKVYDGTAKVTGDAARFVNSVYVEYTDPDDGQVKPITVMKKVDGANYKDAAGRPGSGKNAAGEKDVTFKFTLDDKNFNLANLTGVTTETAADGTTTRHYTRDYDKDLLTNKALGEIKKRNVLLTVNPVQKIYDGTNAVKKGSYESDGTEHANGFADMTETLVLEKAARKDNGELLTEHGLVESDGAVLDVANVNAHYEDSNPGDAADANRSLTGRDASGYKKVAYTVRLKGDGTVSDPNENYTFVNSGGTDITELDAGTGKKDRVVGVGDIWRKKLTAVATPHADKIYDSNAVVKDATVQAHLYLIGQTNGDNVQFDNTSFDTAHNNNAVRAYYGTKNENGAFTQNPHVNRNADGGVIDRDVQYRNLQPAFNDLKNRNNAAKNYFVQEQEVFGTGKITPLAVTANDVRRVWRGPSFTKTYDGKTYAEISGKTMSAENKGDFKRKLDLILGLSTGEQITLDYTMYGEDKADAEELRPHYDDKNVKNSDGVTTDKDMIYTLKGLKSIKELVKNDQNVDYDYSALATAFGDGTQVRLKGAGSETPDNTQALITPKKVTVAAPYISKTYDGTVNIPAGAVAGWTQADLVADEETRTMMAKDKVTVAVDATGSKFLAADGVTENADASADPSKTVNGKRVKYQINLQSTAANPAVETGNYEFSTGGNTVVGKGDIMRRMVHVVADDTKTPVDKMYDGDDYVRKADGTVFKRKFRLEGAVSGDTGILTPDVGNVVLNNDEVAGQFASPTGKYGSKDVERDANGNVINKDVVYKGFTLGGTASNNYIVAERDAGYKQANAAKITPREIDLSLKNPHVTKEYDGTKDVKDNAGGNFRTDNIKQDDNNAVYNGINHAAAWEVEKAEYNDANAGSGKSVKYDVLWKDGNYAFKGANVTAGALPDAEGVYRASIAADTGEITKRKVDVAAKDAKKTYDATADVHGAWDKLEFKQRGDGEKNIVNEDDERALKAALKGTYVKSDPAVAYDDSKDAGENKKVEYTFNPMAAVMNNYAFANEGTALYGDTVTGNGTIDRRHLNVVPDSKLVMAGRGAANFTGRIEDGVNPGAATTPEIRAEIGRLNDGVFSYGPAGDVDYMVPGPYDIHGWYMNGSTRTRAVGNYGPNFILDEVRGTLAVVPMGTDGVDRTFRPDSAAYVHASYDENNTFGKSRDVDASLAYRDQGVNTGSASVVPTGTGTQPGAGAQPSAGSSYRPGTQPSAGAQPGAGVPSTGGSAVDRSLAAAAGMGAGSGAQQSGARAGVSGKQGAGAQQSTDGSYRAADRGLADALGQSSGAGYYNGKGYSHTDDDEEEEIKKKTKASA